MDESKKPSQPNATFLVKIHFNQNTTWQGAVTWLDKKRTQHFRSALELVRLMDSALREGPSASPDWPSNDTGV